MVNDSNQEGGDPVFISCIFFAIIVQGKKLVGMAFSQVKILNGKFLIMDLQH